MFKNKELVIKIIVMAFFLVFAFVITYVIQGPVFYTHFFYIPIVLACIWWKRKGIFVAIFLAVLYFLTFSYVKKNLGDEYVIGRAIMFLAIAYLVIKVRERGAKAEEEMKLAYEKIDNLFNTSGDALCVIDKDYNIIKFNDGYLKLLCIDWDEAQNKKCYELFHGPSCNTPSCPLTRILNGESRVESDIEKYCKNGRKKFCIITATPYRDSDRELSGIVENIKDITDRKLAEEALRESEEKYRSFVKNFKGIAYQTDMNLKPIFFDGAIKSITGYTSEDFIKGEQKWIDLIYDEDLPKFQEVLKKLYKIPNFSYEQEYRIVCKDGKIKWVEEILQNSCDESGNPNMIQSILYDITERKQTEEALQRSEERFLQSQKMEAVGRLAGGVAHDFNNLITIITGNSDLVLDELNEDSPFKDDIEEIYKAGERASALTRQLLAFSRKQILQPKVLDINSVINDIQRLIKRLIGEDISLNTIFESSLSRVKADPGQIEQVIMNLAINARDAMPDGGLLTIRTENVVIDNENSKVIHDSNPGKYVCISVEDTGIGIDKEIKDKIFEPFFSTKPQGEGTGLGLSTVYGIVRQHEGLITVYSEPGQGTVFKIYLPALSIKQEGRLKQSVVWEKFKGNSERILLVEDEEGVRRFASKVLKRNGYTVFEAENSKEAVSIFEREKGNFAIVLSDVVLPDKNGIQLVDELKSRNPKLKVILCSGYYNQKSQWPIIYKRKIKFLKKPYNKLELLKAIKELKTRRSKEP